MDAEDSSGRRIYSDAEECSMTRDLTARLSLILLLAMSASGCEIVGGIFKAGIWVGAIIVILIIAVIMWIINRARG